MSYSKKKSKFEVALDDFLFIEKKLNLFSYEVGGVPVWEIIRYPLFKGILIKLKIESKTVGQTNFSPKRLFRFLKYLSLSFSVRNPFLIKKESVIFVAHSRRKYVKGKYTDIYTDLIADSLKEKYHCVTLEHLNRNTIHYPNVKTENIYYLDLIWALSKLIEFIFKCSLVPNVTGFSGKLELYIREKFEINCAVKKMVENSFLKWKSDIWVYKKLFSFVKPKIIFIVDGARNQSMVAAAKELNIPTAELQHGSPAKGKLNYDFPEKIKSLRSFSDYFLTFGKYWETSSSYPLPKENIISIGFPYVSKKKSEYDSVNKKDQLLIISQPTVSKMLIQYVAKISKDKGDLHIVYKLHPKENIADNKQYEYLKELGVSVVGNECDIYDLFSTSRWQMGVYSTALYEGLMFSCVTFIVKLPGYEFMKTAIDEEIVRLVCSDEDVKEYLTKEADVCDKYFSEYSASSLERFIENCVS